MGAGFLRLLVFGKNSRLACRRTNIFGLRRNIIAYAVDTKTQGIPIFWTSGLLDFWTSGLLDFWTSGLLDFWTSGLLEVRATGRTVRGQIGRRCAGVQDCWITEKPEFWITGYIASPVPQHPIIRHAQHN